MLNGSDVWIIIAAIMAAAATFIVGSAAQRASSSRSGRFKRGGPGSRPSSLPLAGGRSFGGNGDAVVYSALVSPGFTHASSSDSADRDTRHDGGASNHDGGSTYDSGSSYDSGSGGFGGSGGSDGGSSSM